MPAPIIAPTPIMVASKSPRSRAKVVSPAAGPGPLGAVLMGVKYIDFFELSRRPPIWCLQSCEGTVAGHG